MCSALFTLRQKFFQGPLNSSYINSREYKMSQKYGQVPADNYLKQRVVAD